MSRYLVHSLRLSYLRNVGDQQGKRIISFSPSYTHNPYILAASLADVARWPELNRSPSPPISNDDETTERPSDGSGAPGLKHHQTIMGNRSGALGLRVSGRRVSTSKRASRVVNNVYHKEAESTPPAAPPPSNPTFLPAPSQVEIPAPRPLPKDDVLSEPQAREPQFVPRFKGAAEMEARRRLRMMARRGHPQKPPSLTAKTLNPDISSEEEEEPLEDEEDDDSDPDQVGNDLIADEADEFDPWVPRALINAPQLISIQGFRRYTHSRC